MPLRAVGTCSGHRFLKVRVVCWLNEVIEVLFLTSIVSEAIACSLVKDNVWPNRCFDKANVVRSHTARLPKHKGNGQNITCFLLLIYDQSQRRNKISSGSECINYSGIWQSFVLDVPIPGNVS